MATVNGLPIRLSELEVAQQSLPQQYRNMPLQAVFPALLDRIVDSKLVVQEGKKNKVNEDPAFKKRMAFVEDQVLQDFWIQREIARRVTAEKLQQRYEERLKSMPTEEEVHARHILVSTEDEAKALIAEIKKGAAFDKLAKEKSTDKASGAEGGDLGWFKKSDMVKEFADAAFALKKGELSDTPVKTQFGYHVIKLEDRRKAPPPAFEELADQLREEMAREAVTAQLDQLRSGAKIEKFNIDGSKGEPAPAKPARAGDHAARGYPRRTRPAQVELTFLCVFGVGSALRSGRVPARLSARGSSMAVKHAQSPLAPKTTPTLPRIAGVKLGAAQSGVRYKDRDDVMLAVVPAGATIAGVLTRSKTSSAPVDWCRECLPGGKVRGDRRQFRQCQRLHRQAGDKAVEESTRADRPRRWAATRNEVFISSTGVIGEPPTAEKIAAVAAGNDQVRLATDAWEPAARAIMTTDTFPKLATRHAEIGERTVTINGFAEGLGHDRARHGDDARLSSSPTRRCPARVLQTLLADAADSRSTASPSMATPRPATRCCWSRPAQARHRADRRAPTIRSSSTFARARRVADRSGAADRARRRGRRRSS